MEKPLSERMHIDVHTLRYFLTFIDEGTMRKAANTLHLTQPTLSRQIGLLEQRVGKQLYERKAGRVHLTQEGRLLHRYALQIVELADKAALDLSEDSNSIAGHVALGCAESQSIGFLADCINRVRSRYPGIVVDLTIGSPLESFERLDVGILDFLLDVEGPSRSGFERLPLSGGNSWVILMRADDPLAQRAAISPEDLEGASIVCSRLVLKSGILDAWAGPLSESLNVGVTFNLGTYAITVLAAHGVGYVLTYKELHDIVGDHRVVARPLDPPIPVDKSVLVWKRHRALSPACMAFLEEAKAMCSELPHGTSANI